MDSIWGCSWTSKVPKTMAQYPNRQHRVHDLRLDCLLLSVLGYWAILLGILEAPAGTKPKDSRDSLAILRLDMGFYMGTT